MARGQRKSIEEKIQQKQEVIDALEVRLEHEREELEALICEQKQKEVEILYDFIKESNLDVCEATEALKHYIVEHEEVLA
jgi:DNA repair protein RadC